ncbi:hypothetical protein M5E87_10680 [Flavonifractor plautii]|nr:hypothetical protein M5E87_10680 [Flavonifractor plautii]
MTGMVMPFFKIDAVLNSRLEIVELRAGEHRQEHRQAVALSQALNGMRRAEGARDVVFVNANAKYNEALIAIRVAAMDLKPGATLCSSTTAPRDRWFTTCTAPLAAITAGLLAAL